MVIGMDTISISKKQQENLKQLNDTYPSMTDIIGVIIKIRLNGKVYEENKK